MSGLTMIMSSEQDSAVSSFSPSSSVFEVVDRINTMISQESTTYKCRDYMGDDETCSFDSISKPLNQRERSVDQECRVKICEWCYQVTDFCKFRREVVAISMSYLDRFLSSSSERAQRAIRDRKDYQLAAMTTLYIAIKIFEPMAMDAGLLSSISHGYYTEIEIVEMEQEILTSLNWMMNGPTAHDFLSHIIGLLITSEIEIDNSVITSLLEFSRFQVEIAVSDYNFVTQKPSVLALAAILNSSEGIDEDLFPAQTRFDFLKMILDDSRMDPFSPDVNAARIRLLDLFAKNSGYDLPQIANLTPVIKSNQKVTTSSTAIKSNSESSPLSVATLYHFQPSSSRRK